MIAAAANSDVIFSWGGLVLTAKFGFYIAIGMLVGLIVSVTHHHVLAMAIGAIMGVIMFHLATVH